MRDEDASVARNARWVALWTTLITFVHLADAWCGASIRARPDSSSSSASGWLAEAITYHMGVDGISVLFVMLTTALMPICIIVELDADPDAGARNT